MSECELALLIFRLAQLILCTRDVIRVVSCALLGLRGTTGEVATWLILPVVIRSSQRLSHARLSINYITVKLRMAHYISYSLFDSPLLLG